MPSSPRTRTSRWSALLAAAEAGGFALVPFGGGTSVVGGVRPDAGTRSGVVAISFDRMAELLDVDVVSCTARVQPGMTGPVLERLLAARGLTWGHVPQSWERASIGGYAATRSAGQSSTGYGRSDATVEAMVVATPRGTLRLGRAPSSAAGPDLRALFLGSEGVLGVITEVTLRVRRVPSTRWFEAVMLPDLDAGLQAFRELAQTRACPDVMRLSDLRRDPRDDAHEWTDRSHGQRHGRLPQGPTRDRRMHGDRRLGRDLGRSGARPAVDGLRHPAPPRGGIPGSRRR